MHTVFHRRRRCPPVSLWLMSGLALVWPAGGAAGRSAALANGALNPNPPSAPVRVVFVHHSTGEAWLADDHGQLGLALASNSYFVSDTNYGWTVNGDPIGDRTDIGNWWEWFAGPTHELVMAALFAEARQHCEYSRLASAPGNSNEIVMFKSCFPNSHLGGNPDDPPTSGANPLRGQDASSEHHTVANAKGIYNDILATFAAHPEKLFVVITAPPLRASDTDAAAAANARAFNTWLVNDWRAGYGGRNVFVFDFFNVLTSNGGNATTNDLGRATGNHHRFRSGAIEYITTQGGNTLAYPTGDSHPSAAGDLKATGEFVPLLNIAYHCWRGTGGCPGSATACTVTCTATVPTSAQAGTAVPFEAQATAAGCTGATTFHWTFGDGSPAATGQNTSHVYPAPGSFTWTLTVVNGTSSCTRSGTITVTGQAASPRGVRRRLTPSTPTSGGRLQPSDLVYLGAFRLPDRADDAPEEATWEYGGEGLAYRSNGDPSGGGDGFPGSLFGTGLDQVNLVSEVSIPAPVISARKDLEELPTATTLQPFADVRGNLFTPLVELPRVGLCVLADVATGEKLHMCWGQHLQEDAEVRIPSHGWCNPTLADPDTRGAWWIGDVSLYAVNGYLLEIPDEWATAHVGGRRLGTGRFRDGGWSGMGPSLYAYAPWLAGNPPPPGTRLSAVQLLQYDSTLDGASSSGSGRLAGYQDADEWEGSAWITTPSGKQAVVFAGTKGTGAYWWYGWADPTGTGTPCVEMEPGGEPMCFRADGAPCPAELVRECEGHTSYRGFWSSAKTARLIFYDPEDFARVARGDMQANEPQPYAYLNLDPWLFLPDPPVEPELLGTGVQRRFRIGELAYDRAHGHLFILERFADGAKPIVHVFRVH